MESKTGKHLHRALAVLLSVCMVLALNPASALAASDPAQTPMETAEGSGGAQNTEFVANLNDNITYDENNAGVGSQVSRATATGNGTAVMGTNVNVRVTDKVRVVALEGTYVTSGNYSEVSAASNYMQADMTNTTTTNVYTYEWTRAKRALAAPDGTDYEPDTTFAGAERTGTLTGAESYEIKRSLSGDFTAADEEYSYEYSLSIYKAGVTDEPAYKVTFPPITVSNDYGDITFSGPDEPASGALAKVETKVQILKTGTGDVTNADSAATTQLSGVAQAAGMQLVDGAAYNITAGENLAPVEGKPAYKTVYYVKMAVPDDVAEQVNNGGQVKIIGTMKTNPAQAYDSGSLTIQGEAGSYYVEVAYPDAPQALGTFALAYRAPELPAQHTVSIVNSTPGMGSAVLSGGTIQDDGSMKFISGTNATVTFTPALNNSVKSFAITDANGNNVTYAAAGNGSYTFKVESDITVSVEFAGPSQTTRTFTMSKAADSLGGSATVAGLPDGATFSWDTSYTVADGTQLTITFAPDSANNTVQLEKRVGANTTWEQVGVTNNVATIVVNDNIELRAKFVAGASTYEPISVTIAPSQNGAVTLAGGQTGTLDKWPYGTQLILNVSPDQNYKLTSITYDDGTGAKDASGWLSANGSQLILPATLTIKDLTIAASFTPMDVHVTLATSDNTTNGGSVWATSGSDTKNGIGTHSFVLKSTVRVWAQAAANYALSSIKIAYADGTTTEYTATGANKFLGTAATGYYVELSSLEQNVTATATFEAQTMPTNETIVSVTTVGDGSVGITGSTVRLTKGDSYAFSFTPGSTSSSANVFVDGVQVATNVLSYTLATTAASPDTMEMRVVFTSEQPTTPPATQTYTVTATAGPGGTIDPSGQIETPVGTARSLSIVADSGYVISDITGVEASVAQGAKDKATYTLTVNAAANISVAFKLAAPGGDDTEDYYNLTVEETAHGRVDPAGQQRILAGSIRTLSFFPDEGYELKSVMVKSGNNAAVDRKSSVVEGTLTISIDADTVVTATFDEISNSGETPIIPVVRPTANVVSTFSQGGSISPVGTQTVYLDVDGAFLNFTMTPDAGYKLVYLEVEGGTSIPADAAHMSRVGDSWSATFKVADQNWEKGGTYTVRAVFAQDPVEAQTFYKVTTKVSAPVAGAGTISPDASTMLEGTSQTFYFFGNTVGGTSYTLSEVYVNDARVPVSDNSYTLESISRDTLIEAVFTAASAPQPKPTTYRISASASNGGTISPAGTTEVVEGGSLVYTVQPNAGYKVSDVKVDGRSVLSEMNGPSYQFDNVSANHSISVDFTEVTAIATEYCVVTVQAGMGGSVSPDGGVRVVRGKELPITFKPADGYDLEKVVVTSNGSTQEIAATDIRNYSYTLTNVQADTTVTAQFKQLGSGDSKPVLPTTYKISATSGIGGNVSPASIEVAAGARPVFTFTADTGYSLATVTLDGVDVSSRVANDGTLTLDPVSSGHTIAATFLKDVVDPLPEYVEVSSGVVSSGFVPAADDASAQMGTGTVSPMGSMRVSRGGNATFSFIPDEGSQVYYIVVNGGRPIYTSAPSYTLFQVTKNTTIEVAFKKTGTGEKPKDDIAKYEIYRIASTATVGGYVYPTGDVQVNAGKQATFTFAAQSGYALSYITIDGDTAEAKQVPASALRNNQYTFTNVTTDHTLHAVFESISAPAAEFNTITVGVAGAGGTISPDGIVYVKKGDSAESATFDVLAQYGYSVKSIKVGGTQVYPGTSSVSGVTYSASTGKLVVSGNVSGGQATSIVVEFQKDDSATPDKPIVTIPIGKEDTDGDGYGGAVSPGSITAPTGEKQTISIIPDEGKDIDKVVITYPPGTDVSGDYPGASIDTDDDGNVVVTIPGSIVKENDYTVDVRVEEGMDIDVKFKDEDPTNPTPAITTHTLQPAVVGGGYILPAQTMQVVDGSSVVMHFVPLAGYELATVQTMVKTESGVTVSDVTSMVKNGMLTLDKVTANTTVCATFTQKPVEDKMHNAHIPPVVDGVELYPSGDIKVVEGEELPITVVPPAGEVVDKIIVVVDNGGGGTTEIEVPVSGGMAVVPGTDNNGNPTITGDIVDVKIPQDGKHTDASASKAQTYTVTANVARGQGCQVSPTTTKVVSGGSALVTFVSAQGYEVDYVMRDGAIVQRGGVSYCAAAISADTTIDVYFAPMKEYVNITTYIDERGNGSGQIFFPQETVLNGTKSVRYVVVPDAGCELKSVSKSTSTLDGKTIIKNQPIAIYDYYGDDAERVARSQYYEDTATASHNATQTRATDGLPIGQVFYLENINKDEGDIITLTLTYAASDRRFAGQVESSNDRNLSIKASGVAGSGFGRSYVKPYMAASVKVPAGMQVPIEPVADTANDFEFVRLTVNGQDVTDQMVGGIYYLTIGENATYDVVAEFAKKNTVGQYVVTAKATEGGSVSPERDLVAKGGTAVFALAADEGYKVTGVSINGGNTIPLQKGTTTYRLPNIQANTSLEFQFEKLGPDEQPPVTVEQFTIKTVVDSGGTGKGSFSALNPKVDKGGSRTISFIPGANSHVAKVVVEQNGATQVFEDSEAPLSWTFSNVLGDCAVTVTFDKDDPVVDDELFYYVNISSDDNGTLFPQGTNIKVRRGQPLVVYVYPNDGYELDKFMLDGVGVVRENTQREAYSARASVAEDTDVSMLADVDSAPEGYAEVHSFRVEGNGSLDATFKRVVADTPVTYHTVNATAGQHGSISPAGAVSVPDGGDMAFTFTADAGYEVASVTVNGQDIGAPSSYTMQQVTADGAIHVEFKAATAAGSQSAALRVVRSLTSLAKTGDIQAPAILGLMAIACGALGVAIVAGGRRRKEAVADE